MANNDITYDLTYRRPLFSHETQLEEDYEESDEISEDKLFCDSLMSWLFTIILVMLVIPCIGYYEIKIYTGDKIKSIFIYENN